MRIWILLVLGSLQLIKICSIFGEHMLLPLVIPCRPISNSTPLRRLQHLDPFGVRIHKRIMQFTDSTYTSISRISRAAKTRLPVLILRESISILCITQYQKLVSV